MMAAVLDDVLRTGGITSRFQPIVDLETRAVVAYEALARGPEGSVLESPRALLHAAEELGLLAETDWACREAAVAGALTGGLEPPTVLFLNVEPDVLDAPAPGPVGLWDQARRRLRVVLEVKEEALTAQPAELLHLVSWMRELGWGVAVDDVGAQSGSLALLPLIRPDVIKLDMRVVQERLSAELAEVVNAVTAQEESSGVVVVAKGIENEQHLATALAVGARYGQGRFLGRPERLPRPLPATGDGLDLVRAAPPEVSGAPFDLLKREATVRRAPKRMVYSISRHLERQAAGLGRGAIVLTTFEGKHLFGEATQRRYAAMAKDAALVAAIGPGLGADPAPGVRGSRTGDDDPTLSDWSVIVIGHHFAAALASRGLDHDGRPDLERERDFLVTYDRAHVIEAASLLLGKLLPLSVRELPELSALP